MRFTIIITVQFGDGPELRVFRSDVVQPERFSAILSVAQATVCSTLAAIRLRKPTIREYLGNTLLNTITDA